MDWLISVCRKLRIEEKCENVGRRNSYCMSVNWERTKIFWAFDFGTKAVMHGELLVLWRASIFGFFFLEWHAEHIRLLDSLVPNWRRENTSVMEAIYLWFFQYPPAGRKNILAVDRARVWCYTNNCVKYNFVPLPCVHLLRPMLPNVRLS